MLDIVTNAIPITYQSHIQLMTHELQWWWSANTSFSPDDPQYKNAVDLLETDSCIIENGQFTHTVYANRQIQSEIHGFVVPVLYMFADKAGIQINNISRIRINLLLQDKTFKNYNYNFPHTDPDSDKSFIYYINDADGDTVFFNEFKSDEFPKKFTINSRVTPQQGSGVFFNSSQYHASSNPTNHKTRYVINFNFN
jgi:hypothetical protein